MTITRNEKICSVLAALCFVAAWLICHNQCRGAEWTGVNGETFSRSNRTHLIIIGSLGCAPLNAMVSREIAPLKDEYPDVPTAVIFPCQSSLGPQIRLWQEQIQGAAKLCAVELHVSDLWLTNWANLGYPSYGGYLYDAKGQLLEQWAGHRRREKIEPRLTRELLDLRICLSNGVPCVSWRKTALNWEPVWTDLGQHGKAVQMQLKPNTP